MLYIKNDELSRTSTQTDLSSFFFQFLSQDFKRNGFEQFCINYANEYLQQFLIDHIFKQEQVKSLIDLFVFFPILPKTFSCKLYSHHFAISQYFEGLALHHEMKQPSEIFFRKRYSKNMQQTYRGTHMHI